MKIFMLIIALGTMMLLSVTAVNAAKANNDRTQPPANKVSDKSKKHKGVDGGAEAVVSWGTNVKANNSNNKSVNALNHNASRSNTTATKIQPEPKPDPKGDKKDGVKKPKKK